METQYKYNRATISESVSFIGVGLHTGKTTQVTLKPSVDRRGIYFVRKDVSPGTGVIDAMWYNVSDTTLSTNLSNEFGVSVHTVEHLMSALRATGIDNIKIEIDGPEVPIMDGSAEVFVKTIQGIGKSYLAKPKEAIWVTQPIVITEGDKFAILMPHSVPQVTVCIDFPDTVIGSQCYSLKMEGDNFADDVAYARTFGFSEQIDALKKQGLVQGGSLINAVLVDGETIINPEGLRVENEFVRHKVLDAVGDIALAGVPVIGHYYAYKAGHELNNKLLQKVFSEPSSWSRMNLKDGEDEFSNIEDMHVDNYSELAEKPLDAVSVKKIASI
ncbi:UDP-3-O-[3-hydroxymyristoyl] N-acetylglucosamine deacetylase [hydrothermal vent metagenome]|uniref:UDP-3-O-acyl-N-acetylglucosamine deacetylase n=1 Tax=hydrothermal vent metagenome TaxID=652676 RepID=A0A3B0Y1V1_9ZZZZ